MKNVNKRFGFIAMTAIIGLTFTALLFSGCATNPLTGKSTMAFVGNDQLFAISFSAYQEFLNENTVITGTAEADMVTRVGENLAAAAQKWLTADGNAHFLDDYRWEYKLIKEDKTINASCMPGGKIVVYTGILPVTQTEDGLAVVLGHEVAHALLNHGQQRVSAGLLQQLGALSVMVGMGIAGASDETQAMVLIAYGIGTQFGAALPFSRSHESEADHYGLLLMAIAGYNPEVAAPFWERMAAAGGGGMPEFLSTHPSPATRIRQLQGWTPEAKAKAAEFRVTS
jgi:predicted Zn-dependent protease